MVYNYVVVADDASGYEQIDVELLELKVGEFSVSLAKLQGCLKLVVSQANFY